ncbi:MAG: undecaprenyl-diphosphate phosphatase [Fidelibacterota bacterium]
MTNFDAIILGIIQGFTEFLPISSSGHLVLIQELLHLDIPGNQLEVVMHAGTLFSILVVFWQDLVRLAGTLTQRASLQYVIYLVVGTLPAVIVGLGFKTQIESAFDSTWFVGMNLLFTGTLLLSTRFIRLRDNEVGMKSSVGIGLAQALAILPGISRSGSTISIAMVLGISPAEAARFSFLLAIPALLGAGLLTALDGFSASGQTGFIPLTLGFLTSFFTGWTTLKWLLTMLKKGQFYWFGAYCIIIGILTITLL